MPVALKVGNLPQKSEISSRQISKNGYADNADKQSSNADCTENDILLPYKSRKLALWEVDYMEAVPDENLKTVVFLCVEEETEGGKKRIPRATGFLVNVPIEDSPGYIIEYVVTARHCIHEAVKYKQIFIRANRNDGEFIEIATNAEDWVQHDNADVALIPFFPKMLPSGIKRADLALISIDLGLFVGGPPEYKMAYNIPDYGEREIQPRIGHLIYFLGLFTEHYGKKRNLPIARFGNISHMPDLITLKEGGEDDDGIEYSTTAYLAEFHSLGGHSGSPVFFLIPIVSNIPLRIVTTNGKQERIEMVDNLISVTGFMGLISGHYPIPESAKRTGEFKHIAGDIKTDVSSGIAIITPAEAVRQLLMRNDLIEQREEISKIAEANEPKPILDSATERNIFIKDNFKHISGEI
jgi:hypothetical protein